MRYLALDVETANADYSSICQIGIVLIDNFEVIEKWSTLINPETYFDFMNTSIHGIDESQVRDSPTFDQVYPELLSLLENNLVIHHMPFDKVALTRACTEYNLAVIQCTWLDSAKVVRRTWEQFSKKGYGLSNICSHLDIVFNHHDALEDALAASKSSRSCL